MNKELINKNAPEKLLTLAERWFAEDKSFYLGPENIFFYNSAAINYLGADDISREYGSWCICTSDSLVPKNLQLKKTEIEEIAFHFAEGVQLDFAELYLSDKCNSQCKFCPYHGQNTEYYDTYMKSERITIDTELAKRRIDKLKEAGVKTICVGGDGDLFMYKGWEEIMQYLADNGLGQYIVTNGFSITEDIVKKIAKIGIVGTIKISLHANTFETWSAITGSKNEKLYNNAINAPLLLKQYGIPTVGLAFVKDDRNIHEIKDFLDYWVEKVDTIVISHGITNDEVTQNNLYYNQFNEPAGLCGSAFGRVLVLASGRMCPCCGSYILFNDKNSGTEIDVNIDNYEGKDLNKLIFNITKTQLFKQMCSNCWGNERRGNSNTVSYYGYKNSKNLRITAMPLWVTINKIVETHQKTIKKTILYRLKKEVTYFFTKKR